jgi:tetratricopeptide (TPR) repeat protein
MKTIDFNYFIERYISGEMEPAEKVWFEKELADNPSLAREVDLRRKTDEILRNGEILSLRSKMASIANDYEKRRTKTIHGGRILRYAAMVAFLITAGSLFWLPNRRLSGEKLFDKFYEPGTIAGLSVTRSGNQSLSSDYIMAIDEYRSGNFEEAIDHFIRYTAVSEDNPEVFMLLGNSYAETSKYVEAGQNYKKVVDHNNNLYIEDANWLLGLCYLKTGEYDKARARMEMISQSESRHSRNASVILRKLRE